MWHSRGRERVVLATVGISRAPHHEREGVPVSHERGRAIEAVEERLGGFDRSNGTIRFSPESPLPDDVLADLVRARKQEISKAR